MAKQKETFSKEVQDEALSMAKKVQKPGQTKEQTKLIAQGIQKGIAEYKKLAKSKQREADKAKKKKTAVSEKAPEIDATDQKTTTALLPWCLLTVSWLGFISYYFLVR